MASFAFNEGIEEMAKGTWVWTSSTIKCRLVSSATTPNKDDVDCSGYASIDTDETLGSKTIVKDTTNDRILFKAANPTFGAVAGGSTVGWAIVYYDNGGTGIPIFCHDVADTPSNGGDITINWPVVGSDDDVAGHISC